MATERSLTHARTWLLVASIVAMPMTAMAQGLPGAAPAANEAGTEDSLQTPFGDIDRIRKALASEPTIKIDDSQLRYYVNIVAKQRTFADYVKGYDLVNGPTRGGNPMTHREFLDLVTPKELHSSGGITAYELLQFSFTNWLGQMLARKAVDEVRSARDTRDLDEIRARIDRELAALPRSKP
jgi:hypothetical protein